MAGDAKCQAGDARGLHPAVRLWRDHRGGRRCLSKEGKPHRHPAHGHRPGERCGGGQRPQRRTGGLSAAGGDRFGCGHGVPDRDRPGYHDAGHHPGRAGEPFWSADYADLPGAQLWGRRRAELRADGGGGVQPAHGRADRPLCCHEPGWHIRAQRLGRRHNGDAGG